MKQDKKIQRMITYVSSDLGREIEAAAKAHKLDVPEFSRQAIEFYSDFDPDFLKQVKKIADGLRLPVAITVQNLLMSFIAHEAAVLETFPNWRPKMTERAFQLEGGKLVTSDKLSEIAKAQALRDAQAIRGKLVEVKKGGEAKITYTQAATLAAYAPA